MMFIMMLIMLMDNDEKEYINKKKQYHVLACVCHFWNE